MRGLGPNGLPTAFYIIPGNGWLVRYVNLTHWPYSLLHLSFVVMGGILAGGDWVVLGLLLAAFTGGMVFAAHALDLMLSGDPLRLGIPRRWLIFVSICGLGIGVAVAVYLLVSGHAPVAYLGVAIVGVAGVMVYNADWLMWAQGRDKALSFPLLWGAYPVWASALAQDFSWSWAVLFASIYAALVSACQRRLSRAARDVRRGSGPADLGYLMVLDRSLMYLSFSGIALGIALSVAL